MSQEFLHRLPQPGLLADAVLVVHALFVAFVIGGQLAVMAGWIRGWDWVRNPWFRGIHLVVIAYIVVQTWLGRLCPLTVWEAELRRAAGQAYHDQSFIGYWLGELLFLDLSWTTFLVIYTAFGTLVVVSWVHFPPRRRRAGRSTR